MTENLIYGVWGAGFHRIVRYEKPAKLQKAHQLGKPYNLTIGEDPENPDCFLEIGINGYIHVGFIDELKRRCLMCYFATELPGRLMLYKAAYDEYDGDTDTVIKMTEFIFTTLGQFNIVITDYVNREKEILKANNEVDVSGLWTDYPEFGCYDGLIKVAERFPKNLKNFDWNDMQII